MQSSTGGKIVTSPKVNTLSLRLFGATEIQVNGQLIPKLRSFKGKWLIALLAIKKNQEISRRWLSGTLWPESDPELASASLRRTLTDLKKCLGCESWRIQNHWPNSIKTRHNGC